MAGGDKSEVSSFKPDCLRQGNQTSGFMIFTDTFTFIHEPKTGGTFVTKALLRAHRIKWNRLTHLVVAIRKQLTYQTRYGTFIYHHNKHGTCREMPAEQQHKQVLANVRNPFDVLVSQYEFGWWRRAEFLPYYRRVPNFERDYANFPRIDFAGYVTLVNRAFRGDGTPRDEHEGIGYLSEQFIKYYFKNPAASIIQINNEYASTAHRFSLSDYKTEMFDVSFIHTHRLNRDLHDFLIGKNYQVEDTDFILTSERVLPLGKGRTANQKWERYYTAQLKEFVRERERFLFEAFPEFDR